LEAIQQTSDGGYIVAGFTDSFGAGNSDVWVMKLNSTGTVAWQKTYGGTGNEYARSIQQTSDGGYIVTGNTHSFGAGDADAWVMKLNSTGTVAWQKTYGGLVTDYAVSIQQTADGGYIMAGTTDSFGTGSRDFWAIKLDSTGTVAWQKTYGGMGNEYAGSIQQTADGGYIMTGYTTSFGPGDADAWVLKLDSAGAVTWQKTYGGANYDTSYSIQQTADGGYIVAGYTTSFGAGDADAWVLKLDSAGAVTWQKTYGGAGGDYANSIQQTSDGGYIVAGNGSHSAWLIKLVDSGAITWEKVYKGAADQKWAGPIQQTQEGGYIVGGGDYTSAGDSTHIFILKLSSTGSIGSCPFERVTTAVVSDTTVTGVDTSVVPIDTAVTGVDSAATESDSTASANLWCPLTEDAQGLKVGTTRKKKGEGSIISGEGLISCPGICQQEYNKGLTVTLYADPSDLSTFLGWKPTPSGCETTNPVCQITMDEKKSVKAIFQGPNKLKVVTTFKNGATGTVTSGDDLIICPGDCEQTYTLNAPVTLTVTAGAGATFVKWTGKPCKDEATNVCTFEMNKNATVKAIFEPSS
jgi:uncharacterized delta-60 repeat protein